MTAPRFIGLDLAWSERNRSGGAVLVAEEPGRVQLVAASGQLGSDSELLDFVAAYLPDGNNFEDAVNEFRDILTQMAGKESAPSRKAG